MSYISYHTNLFKNCNLSVFLKSSATPVHKFLVSPCSKYRNCEMTSNQKASSSYAFCFHNWVTSLQMTTGFLVNTGTRFWIRLALTDKDLLMRIIPAERDFFLTLPKRYIFNSLQYCTTPY